MYEEFRVTTDDEVKAKLFEESTKLANVVAVPANVERIPTRILVPPPQAAGVYASKLLEKAAKEEPGVTRILQDIFEESLTGLEYKLKEVEPMIRKIRSIGKESKISFEDAAKLVEDALRYTVVFKTEDYVGKIQGGIAALKAKGFELVRGNHFPLLSPIYQWITTGQSARMRIRQAATVLNLTFLQGITRHFSGGRIVV
jgi:hypothetical protein